MNGYQDLEQNVKRIGMKLNDLIGGEIPSLFDGRRWKGQVMERAMRDETFKVQLFRFIDVLPALKNDSLVMDLLNEYFADVEEAPKILRLGLSRLSAARILPQVSARIIRRGAESFARQFIAGRDPEDSLPALEDLNKEGLAITIDLLGEAVLTDGEANEYARRYLELLRFLSPKVNQWRSTPILEKDDRGSIPRLDVSLKVSSFYSQLDPCDWEGSIAYAARGMGAVIEEARESGASVTVDMEHYYLKDLTIAIFKRIVEEHPDYPFLGIALQAYLKDTKQDVMNLVDWAKKSGRRIAIRHVKGAYWDYETVMNRQKGLPVPVFMDKEETDFSYEEITRILMENVEHVRPAIATHNIRSISHAIAVVESLNLPQESYEFQVIYGMAEPVRGALRKQGYRVRAYTPIGALIPGMAYLIRRLLENTSNESFLRNSFMEDKPLVDLLRAPRPKRSAAPKESEDQDFVNEPCLDFSRAENRTATIRALGKAKENFGGEYPLLIGDKEIWTDNKTESLNPANPTQVVGRVSTGGKAEAEKAVEEARKAWGSWRKTSPEQRAEYLVRAAAELRNRRFELIALEVYEVGKTRQDADADIAEAIDFLEYYAREMRRLGKPKRQGNYPGEANVLAYEPKGVGVVIAPWNFPMAIPMGMVSAGIVTGNCVIFKPSGLSPVLGRQLVEVFRAVGLPPGVLQFVPGPGDEVGEHLVGHPGIDFVAFTGSMEVGLRIVEMAAETQPGQGSVKKVIAEMGGKNAIIVDETADLDEAVSGIVHSSLGFQGQKCSACSRVIFTGDGFDQFCTRLKEAMESINIGPPEEPATFMGPVVDENAQKRIQRYIEMGKKEGKALLLRETNQAGYFVGPAIFTNVSPGSLLAQEEIFGPVVAIMRAHDLDEALEIANGTVQALTGGLYSRSPANIEKVREEFRVGNLYVNRTITGALVGRQPFGGFGMSGIGSKAGGPDYLLQFTNAKSISENTLRRGFAAEI
jgi:RHH-type transcriptional regulator, proline utilization regulon repressor / proline dehydrogenase / delta 1-pyrroline-5-carboxylate dehydrogenase